LGLLAFTAVPAVADTVKLHSGELVEGRVADVGDRLVVTTPDGELSIRWRHVDVVLRDQSMKDIYRERRAALAKDDAPELYALALWAKRSGLHAESRECAAAAVKVDPEHDAARALLAQQKVDGEWLSGDKLLAAKGFVLHGGKWVLKEEAEVAGKRARPVRNLSDDEARVADLISRAASGKERAQRFALEALGGLPPDALARPALRALRRGTPAERRIAAGLLATWGDVDAVRPLIYAATMDREKSVRRSAVAALKSIDHDDTVRPFARALWSKTPLIRTNAAEALGAIGGGRTVEWLIRRVHSSGGPGGRNHLSVQRQMSYISDFDVEIAQAAQIGDPIVGTIRSGVVLDTRVLGVTEEFTTVEKRVFYNALREASGQKIGDDVALWKEWYEREGREALAAR